MDSKRPIFLRQMRYFCHGISKWPKSEPMKTDSEKAGQYINALIQLGENQRLDFKFEISDAKKMARTFSAFANTDGGKLLIGVKDNGRITGIRSEEEIYMAESSAHLYCKPVVEYHIRKWFVEGRCVLEIDIPASPAKPHFARNDAGEWIAYVRVGDQNIQANSIIVDFWKSQGKQKGVLLNYGQEEKILMAYLKENEKISLSRFTKIARIGKADGEKILVNLMLLKVIKIEITEKGVYFRVTSDQEEKSL
jgi:predicted HTH transcriptional regulator